MLLQDRAHHHPHPDAGEEEIGMKVEAGGDAGAHTIIGPGGAPQRHFVVPGGMKIVHPFPRIAAAVPHTGFAHSFGIGGYGSGTGLTIRADPIHPVSLPGNPPFRPTLSTVETRRIKAHAPWVGTTAADRRLPLVLHR
jgi:hypothetical protein